MDHNPLIGRVDENDDHLPTWMGLWKCRCSCGWWGGLHHSSRAAHEDHRDHAAAARGCS